MFSSSTTMSSAFRPIYTPETGPHVGCARVHGVRFVGSVIGHNVFTGDIGHDVLLRLDVTDGIEGAEALRRSVHNLPRRRWRSVQPVDPLKRSARCCSAPCCRPSRSFNHRVPARRSSHSRLRTAGH